MQKETSELLPGFTEIIVMTTGGTIEKTYDEFDGSLANRESSIRQKILSKLRLPYTKLNVFSLMAKDSLHMTDYDRVLIAKTIEGHLYKKLPIVILHGTDTMAKTANVVHEKLKDNSELVAPIVFTGAMKPMGFEDSDSNQNVTEALLAAKILKPGVYISFHNRVFELPNVRKNKEKRTFESF
ncbi:MAG: asparaginase [Halobacteriovoraceae bacterium]|jgi:L-asparaginase|nr:asparaginase [Halobacteriovoraceae bacterium]|tara:strand:+ start:32230 stop:32778 length:549 start_codon:yes stop_codon:yes gene_type:complete